jgi:hypothetical protein
MQTTSHIIKAIKDLYGEDIWEKLHEAVVASGPGAELLADHAEFENWVFDYCLSSFVDLLEEYSVFIDEHKK